MTDNRRFAECVAIVLGHEGGFVNHPSDPGGATNRGITLRTLRDWRGDDTLTADDVRNMTEAEAREIYLARYWNPVRGEDLPPGVDLAVFDWAVLGGVGRSARHLQEALGVTADGAIGRQTLDALRRADPADVIRDVCAKRLAHLQTRPHRAAFINGWTARVRAIERSAMERTRAQPLTMREAQRTDTVQVATQVAAMATPLAAGVPAAVQAFNGLHPAVGVALVVAGLAMVATAAWLAASWLRSRRT
jgi:lysozyme family protein